MRQDRRWAPTVALAFLIYTAAPSRAFELEPGAWKEIETGTEDGKPVEPAVNSTCMTEDEAKDPVKGLSPEKRLEDMRGHCRTRNVKNSDTGLSMRVECGEPGQAQMTFSVDYVFNNAHSYTGTVKSARRDDVRQERDGQQEDRGPLDVVDLHQAACDVTLTRVSSSPSAALRPCATAS